MLTSARDVIVKLLAFTLAMIALPIGSYFLTLNTIFNGEVIPRHDCTSRLRTSLLLETDASPPGNSTFAGATAAVMANAVLIAYVFVAMREDQSEQSGKQARDTKKDR